MNIGTSSLRFFGTLLLLFAFSVSCAKKQASPSITIDLNSKVQGSLSANVSNVFVNVNGPGGLQVLEWDCFQGECGNFVFEFDVNGPGQALVQLLIVANNPASGTVILYGDVFRELVAGVNDLPLSVSPIGNFNSEGRVSGRYIPSSAHPLAGKKLTGQMIMKVHVGVGKPDMKLMKSEIFAGWLNLMLLDNVGFKYSFFGHDQNGNFYANVPLLNDLHNFQGLKYNSPGIQPSGSSRVLYNLNSPVFNEREGVFQSGSFSRKFIGFFGQNPDAKSLCAKNLSSGFSFSGSNSSSRICKTIAAGSCATHYTLGEVLADSFAPGVDGAIDTCALDPAAMEVNLKEIGESDLGPLEFFGPFIADSTFSMGLVNINATDDLEWKIADDVYLPGGVEVFFSADVRGFDNHDIEVHGGDFDCSLLPSHFVSQGVQSVTGGALSSLNVPTSFVEGPKFGFALCPLRPNGEYFGSAIVTDEHSGDQPSPPAAIQVAKPQQTDGGGPVMFQSACNPVEVSLVDDQGQETFSSTGDIAITLSNTGGGQFFHSPMECESNSNAIASPIGVHHKSVVFFKHSSAPSFDFAINASGTGLNNGSLLYTSMSTAPVAELRIMPAFHRDPDNFEMAITEACVPFMLGAFADDGSGNLELIPGGGASRMFGAAGDITESTGLGVTRVHGSQATCSGAHLSSGTMSASIQEYWISVIGTNTGQASNILSSCGAGTCTSPVLDVVNPGGFDHWQVDKEWSGGPSDEVGQCFRYKVGAYDNHQPNSYPTYFDNTTPESITLSDVGTTKGTFYDDMASCDLNAPLLYSARRVMVDNTMTKAFFQYRPHVPGNINIDLGWNGEIEQLQDQANGVTGARRWVSIDTPNSIWDFPDTNFGTPQAMSVTLTNWNGGATVSSISGSLTDTSQIDWSAGAAYPGAAGGAQCGAAIAGGANCDIGITFSPAGNSVGIHETILEIQFDEGTGLSYSRRVLRGNGL